MTGLRASVVVPVKDGAAHLPGLLDGLARQRLDGGLEVVAIDSGSRDDSRAILERHGARVLDMAPATFDHGGTRNLGVREARGDSVVFLSQDALPGEGCLGRLLDALWSEPRLAGAFARQVPRPEADALTRRDVVGWTPAGSERRVARLSNSAEFERLSPSERHRLSAFDNVASAAPRDVLLAHPFAPTRFGEDLEWGQRMLRLGYGLAYVPDAVVVHSHRRSASGLYRRNYLGHRLLFRLFGLRTVPDRAHLARAAVATVAGDLAMLAREGASPIALLAAPAQAVAAVLGQYRGARDELLERPYPGWA
jgi:rhamnosyltransferase